MKEGFVYIMTNKNRTTLYIGVTNSIENRVQQHKSGIGSVFTSKYKLTVLLYYERILGFKNAIAREKQLKNWKKAWKWNFVKEGNPQLEDLAAGWYDD